MILETERLILRPWEESDAEDVYLCAKDPQVGPNTGWPPHQSLEESTNILKTVLMTEENYAIVLKENGRVIGCIGLKPVNGSLEIEPEIGFWLGVPHWGKGYMTEAVRALLRHCFEDIGCEGVWCGYFPGNERSRRVQEKCGFKPHHTETRFMDAMGEDREIHFNYLSKSDWEAQK